jgi:hypothetical protein
MWRQIQAQGGACPGVVALSCFKLPCKNQFAAATDPDPTLQFFDEALPDDIVCPGPQPRAEISAR